MATPISAANLNVWTPQVSKRRTREQKKADGLRTKTLHLKVRPEAWPWLEQAAREVNYAWNWANETSRRAIQTYADGGT